MSLWKWSRTVASNSTADSTINWREGMSPSAVNDSARAMMAAVAKYRDDIAGAIVTGGTASAYTVTTYQTLTAYAEGRHIAFIPHVTNNQGCTIAVDGLDARNLRVQTQTAIAAGTLIAGTPYTAVYDTEYDEWKLHGYYNIPSSVPLAAVIPYAGSTAPNSSFVLCYGQAISRTTYASLFSLLSTTYGAGDGSTTFNLPDLRGRAIFGVDAMGGSGASRIGAIVGATIGSAGGTETHTLTEAQLPSHTHAAGTLAADSSGAHTHSYYYTSGNIYAGGTPGDVTASSGSTFTTSSDGAHTHTISGSTGATGSGSAHSNMPPAIVLSYIMRVL
jgi:microcystin-dependent protein